MAIKPVVDLPIVVDPRQKQVSRDTGAVDQVALVSFLNQYHLEMPRTMLRYVIEKMTATRQSKYVPPRKSKPQ